MAVGKQLSEFKQLNNVPFASGKSSPSPVTIDVTSPIVWMVLELVVEIVTVVGTGTVKSIQDGVKRLLRLVQITQGGSPVKTFGQNNTIGSAGVMMEVLQRSWLEGVPSRLDAGGVMAAPGTNIADETHTVLIKYIIPISVPANRYHREWVNRTALRVSLETWQVQVTWGDATDVLVLAGNATGVITDANTYVKVGVLTDESLDPKWPAPNNGSMLRGGMILKTVSDAQTLGTAAAGNLTRSLPIAGSALAHALACYDNSLLNDDLINNSIYKIDNKEEVYQADWDMGRSVAEFDGDNPLATGLPVGMSMALFDRGYDMRGRVDTTVAQSWKRHLDHNAATGSASIIEQIMYLESWAKGGRG